MTTHDPRDIFTGIYRNYTWEGGYPETVSGAGSTLEATGSLRAGLSALFARGDVLPPSPTVLDAPCGDFNWFRAVTGYGRYIGMDIVGELVAENARQHGGGTVSFQQGDLTRDPLPAADVLICRDCLIHLTDDLVDAVLRNVLASGIPWLLLTTHGNAGNVPLAAVGGYRPINFALPPYSFPAPRLRIADHLGDHEKYLALWATDDLRQALATG